MTTPTPTPAPRWRALVLLCLSSSLLLSLGACLAKDGSESPDSSSVEEAAEARPDELLADLSPAEVVDHARAAMKRPGHVYHQVMQRRQDADLFSNTGRFELWLGPDGKRARKHFEMQLDSRPDEPPMRGRELVLEEQLFERDPDSGSYPLSPDPAPVCNGLSPAEGLVFNCRPDQEVAWEIESGQYDGEPAILLIARFHQLGQPEAEIQAEAYYLDPATWLPRYLRAEGVILYGSPTPYELSATFEHAFIPEAEAPEGLFEPGDPDDLPVEEGP